MEAGEGKYEKVIRLVRKNKPEMQHPETVTEKIMDLLIEEKSANRVVDLIIDFLFGWIYIGWVRKSMVLVSIFIVLLFGYQQAVILKRINALSGKRIEAGSFFLTGSRNEISERIKLFGLSGHKLPGEKTAVSKDDIDEMIRSINKLQIKYQDLMDQIKDNPDLKKYVETRIKELEEVKN